MMNDKVMIVAGGAGFIGSRILDYCSDQYSHLINIDLQEHHLGSEYLVDNIECDLTLRGHIRSRLDLQDKLNGKDVVYVHSAAIDHKNPGASLNDCLDIQGLETEIQIAVSSCLEIIRLLSQLNYSSLRVLVIGSDLSVVAPNQAIYGQKWDYLKSEWPAGKSVKYSIVKHSQLGLVKYLSSYYGPAGISVNMISPGPVYSGQGPSLIAELEKVIPHGRLSQVDEVAKMVSLAAHFPVYVTGQNILIDGGRVVI